MSTNDVVEQAVINVVADSLNIDKKDITLESRFADDFRADSLDLVELMMAFEEKFGCEIPDSEASELVSVAKVIEYIEKHKLQVE